jgi:hypothetical protein
MGSVDFIGVLTDLEMILLLKISVGLVEKDKARNFAIVQVD